MRKKALVVAAIVSIVIAGCIISTGIVKENKSKTEVNSQPSTSMSEQVETPETSTESDIEIIEDETSISDDGLTSSNAGGNSDPVEVEISDDGVVTDKPEPYPDEWSLITQPEDNENNSEDSAESGVIKDVGPSIDLNDPDEAAYFADEDDIDYSKPDPITEEEKQEFIDKVKSYGTTLH